MGESLQTICNGVGKFICGAACFGVVMFLVEWIRLRRPDRKMLLFTLIFVGMAAWRLSVRVFAHRYALGMAIPAAVLAVYPWHCTEQWRIKWLKWSLRGALLAVWLLIAAWAVFYMSRTYSRYESMRYLGRSVRESCLTARRWELVDADTHGIRIVREMDMPKAHRPFRCTAASRDKLAAAVIGALESSDVVLLTLSVRDEKDVDAVLAEVRKKEPVTPKKFTHGKHAVYLFDNRDSRHWGVPRSAPYAPPPADKALLVEDFETPEWLEASGADFYARYLREGYPFFKDGKIFFTPRFRPYFHGNHKPENRDGSILAVDGGGAIDGRYSCRIRTAEYYDLRSTEIPLDGRVRIAADIRGKLGSRVAFKILLVNPQLKSETYELTSFTILDEGSVRHCGFEADLSKFVSRGGVGQLVLSVSGDMVLDNVTVVRADR